MCVANLSTLDFPRLANKQDHLDALDEIDVAEKLDLESLANQCQTPTRIEICSATQGTGKNIDPIIRIGFQYATLKNMFLFITR